MTPFGSISESPPPKKYPFPHGFQPYSWKPGPEMGVVEGKRWGALYKSMVFLLILLLALYFTKINVAIEVKLTCSIMYCLLLKKIMQFLVFMIVETVIQFFPQLYNGMENYISLLRSKCKAEMRIEN